MPWLDKSLFGDRRFKREHNTHTPRGANRSLQENCNLGELRYGTVREHQSALHSAVGLLKHG